LRGKRQALNSSLLTKIENEGDAGDENEMSDYRELPVTKVLCLHWVEFER
jgi:hypothetical protein